MRPFLCWKAGRGAFAIGHYAATHCSKILRLVAKVTS